MDNVNRGLLVVLIAHNELAYVKLNVKILAQELKNTGGEIVVVDNYSDDGLREWLEGQNLASYMIADEELEGYGKVLAIVNEQFADGRDLLLVRANYFLTPGSIAHMQAVLHDSEDIAAVGPVGNTLPGEQKCFSGNTYEEAMAFADSRQAETARTAYLDMDVMMVKGSTRGSLDVEAPVPQAALRGYMRRVLRQGLRFAVVKKAVCFAVGSTKDEPYRALAPELYRKEKLHHLLYSFGDVEYQGVYLYKYLEPGILIYLNDLGKEQKNNVFSEPWPADEVFLSTEEEADRTRGILENLPQKDVLFVTLPLRRSYGGKLVHTAIETFISSLDEEKYVDIEWYTVANEDFWNAAPTRHMHPIVKPTVPRMYGVPDTDMGEIVQCVCGRFISPLEQLLGVSFAQDFVQGLCLKASYVLKERHSYIQFYREVIDRVKPKVIIYSHGQDMSLTYLRDLTLELGIPTLEVAHGVGRVNTYHKNLVYADYHLVYSDIVAAKSLEQGNDKVIGIGKPGVYECVKQMDNPYPLIVISFISSTEKEIFPYARNLAARLDKQKYLIIYKAHTAEINEDNKLQQIAEELGNMQIVGGELDIREVAELSDIVVGIRSSAIFDVLPYPMLKVIAIRDKLENVSEARPNEIIEAVAAAGELVLAEDEEQLYEEVVSYKRGMRYRQDVNTFWPSDAGERFRALVDSYL